MFQVDQEYTVTMIEDGGRTSYHCRVISVEGPLVEVMFTYESKRMIINTHSSAFVSAAMIVVTPDEAAVWADFDDDPNISSTRQPD